MIVYGDNSDYKIYHVGNDPSNISVSAGFVGNNDDFEWLSVDTLSLAE